MARPGRAVPFDSVGPVPRATERGSGLVYSIRWSVPTVAGTGASSCTPTLTTSHVDSCCTSLFGVRYSQYPDRQTYLSFFQKNKTVGSIFKSYSKIYSLNYYLKSHLSKKYFPYLCIFQQFFYIFCVVQRAILSLYLRMKSGIKNIYRYIFGYSIEKTEFSMKFLFL